MYVLFSLIYYVLIQAEVVVVDGFGFCFGAHQKYLFINICNDFFSLPKKRSQSCDIQPRVEPMVGLLARCFFSPKLDALRDGV